MYVHPSLLDGLSDDGRLCAGGAAAAMRYGADIIVLGHVDAYVRSGDLAAVVADHALVPAERTNVVLRVPAGPSKWPLPDDRVAPPSVAAWDLLDTGDQRSVRAARGLLRARADALVPA